MNRLQKIRVKVRGQCVCVCVCVCACVCVCVCVRGGAQHTSSSTSNCTKIFCQTQKRCSFSANLRWGKRLIVRVWVGCVSSLISQPNFGSYSECLEFARASDVSVDASKKKKQSFCDFTSVAPVAPQLYDREALRFCPVPRVESWGPFLPGPRGAGLSSPGSRAPPAGSRGGLGPGCGAAPGRWAAAVGRAGGRRRDPNRPATAKKYRCDICGKAFSRSNTLVTHKVSFASILSALTKGTDCPKRKVSKDFFPLNLLSRIE